MRFTWLIPTLCALAVATAQDTTRDLTMFEGMHERVTFTKSFQSVLIGNEDVLASQQLNDREILLLGRKTGRTSLIVDFQDGTAERVLVYVQRDLSVLQHALADIDPRIVVSIAPDRDAIVLRGTVHDITVSRAAEAAALQYLTAGTRRDAATTPLVAPGAEGQPTAVAGATELPQGRAEVEVINLLRLEVLPPGVETLIQTAVGELGAGDVRVRRFQSDATGEIEDVLVLDGTVPNQVTLTRVLQTAARMYLGRDIQQDDVKVIADESGALTDVQNQGFSGSEGGGFQSQGFGSSASATGAFGGTSTAATDLGNRVNANLGRAKAVSVAEGRILSFIEVDDLPQVRVNVRFYEVDRRDLLSYAPEFEVLYSDFDQPELVPGKVATSAQGTNAADVGAFSNTDVQNVFGFLADGYTQQFQISGEHLAINAAFTILESRELARRLSAPSLMVLSGEQALFQVGGEIPITETFTPTAEVGTFNSVFFKTFGVQLGIRPLVDEYDAITLDVVSQVSEPDDALTVELRETTGENPATTAFELRSIGTSARLEDGQVLLIGGLTGLRTNDGAVFTPWVQELPLIGWLFKRFEMSDEDRDLVVMVNPVIVREPLPEVALWNFPGVEGMLRELGRNP